MNEHERPEDENTRGNTEKQGQPPCPAYNATEARRLLALVHPQGRGFVLSAITAEELIPRYVEKIGDVERIVRELIEIQKRKNAFGVYYSLGEYAKPPQSRGTEDEVCRVRCVWADVDKPTKAEALARINAFIARTGLSPSILIDSGAGYQPLWLLRAPVEAGPFRKESPPPEALLVRAINAMLARELGGDPVIDLARVFRLPGTLNTKCNNREKYPHYTEPLPCRIVEAHPERRYAIEDLEPHVTDADRKKARKEQAEKPATSASVMPALANRLKRASAYLVKIPGAVSGSGGHATTWSAALSVVRGFALPEDVGYDLLAREYNPRCTPPWSEKELRHKISDAAAACVTEGYLLDGDRGHNGDPERRHTTVNNAAAARLITTASGGTFSEEHRTDTGNALRLVRLRGSDLRYVGPWKKWLLWDGRRWAVDDGFAVVREFDSVLLELIDDAGRAAKLAVKASMGGDDNEKNRQQALATAIHAWQRQSQGRARVEAAVALARSRTEIVPKDLDCHPWLLNLLNGTLDLRTAELYPHKREDLLTKLAPVEYNAKATAPTWERFLLEIMDGKAQMVEYLCRVYGYALTGVVREHGLFFLHGKGRNGKSTC